MSIARILLLAAAFLTLGCRSSDVNGPATNIRVLFIGNSYLFSQDIPGMVQALAKSRGDQIHVTSVTGGDMALYDHLNTGDAVPTIMKGGWDYIVLQQGPSSVSYNRDSLRMATAIYDAMARLYSPSVRLALFSSWPQQHNAADFPRAIESYQLAASDVNGVFLPVASAWLEAWRLDPTLELYADGLHPTHQAAYLSALVIYAKLTGKSPSGLPLLEGGTDREGDNLPILQLAAANVTGIR